MRLPAMLKDAVAVFGRVSVVQMARENSAKDRAEGRRLRVMPERARRIFSSGKGTPMTPVEQTRTSWGWQTRRRAVSSTVFSEAARPAGPVAQLALPALTITARTRPFEARKFSLDTITGGATTRFCVKTAAAEARTSLESIARSSAPVFFKPQAVAEKRNPRGRAASERTCIMGGESAELIGRSRKRPPILRAMRCGFENTESRTEAHGLFSSDLSFCSSCAIAVCLVMIRRPP